MNIFGHAGLTLAAVSVASSIFDALSNHQDTTPVPKLRGAESLLTDHHGVHVPKVVKHPRMDYRAVLLGSLLPDIIDKPLAFWILPELVNYGTRSIGHTLIFNIGLIVIALLFLRLTNSRFPITLALASTGHLLLDQMWQSLKVLLWPFHGWSFPLGSTTLDEWIRFLFSIERLNLPEIVGAVTLIWFAIQLYRRRSLLQFLRLGTI